MAEGLSELQRNAFDSFTKSVMETEPKKFKLPQNWCLVINNRRIFHGRTALSDNSNRFLKRYWISSSKHKKLEWQCLINSFYVESKGQCTNPLIRFDLIRGLAVGFVIAYPCIRMRIRRAPLYAYTSIRGAVVFIDIIKILIRNSLFHGAKKGIGRCTLQVTMVSDFLCKNFGFRF